MLNILDDVYFVNFAVVQTESGNGYSFFGKYEEQAVGIEYGKIIGLHFEEDELYYDVIGINGKWLAKSEFTFIKQDKAHLALLEKRKEQKRNEIRS